MAARSSTVEPQLPRPLTRLIGRETELDALLSLLETPGNRSITISGPGGVGKTRLALHWRPPSPTSSIGMSSSCRSRRSATQTSLVVAIAAALGVEPDRSDDVEPVISARLADRAPALVLDNFEQVLAGAPVVAGLLLRAPGLRVVVTSRAALDVAGERRFPLSPLPLPEPDERNVEQVLAHDAVRLFIDRAHAVRPDLLPGRHGDH